jgi:pSer/pThr/pTyr-binding forkhead associated (FHA) protein
MDPVDVLVLAFRIALVVVLYGFLLSVLRAASFHLNASDARPRGGHREGGIRGASVAGQLPLRLRLLDDAEASDFHEPVSRFQIEDHQAVIGRGPAAAVKLLHPTVSAEHATLTRHETGWTIRDSGSTNGSYVNAKRVEGETPLNTGDIIEVGSLRLQVE